MNILYLQFLHYQSLHYPWQVAGFIGKVVHITNTYSDQIL